jgi:WD40 repeat protein
MGAELFTITNHKPYKKVRARPLAVTPNGLQVIFILDNHEDNYESKNNTFEVWNLETRGKLLTFAAHGSDTLIATVTPDGKQMISTANNRTLKVWSLKTGKELFTLTGHSSKVNAIAVTSDGLRMVSASDDRTLKVWDLSNRKIITSFTGESALTCCAVAPDGVTIVAGERSGQVHFLRLEGMEASP